ncbi:MAG: NAD-binding protein [Bacteroidaceae bacterium]|nr:NAD-binding protein [Bacteroidaceae bacterium]
MNLLLTGCFKYTEVQKEKLASLGFRIYFVQQEKEALPLAAAEVDATVCNGLFLSHNIEDFTNLKFIQLTSAGFDRVPVDYIKAKGIALHNARGVYSVPMAEWVLFRVLEHYKQGWFFKNEQEQHQWTKHRGLRELAGSRVAVVGAGNVGQEVAKRFGALGCNVTGFDIHTNSTPFFDEMALTASLLEHIGLYDVVVITAPLLPSTRGLISYDVMKGMKENATLVNIARGRLIDQKALEQVLCERKDLFAALDVFETEPLEEDSPLWTMDNVAVSPHNSFVSDRNNERMFEVMYQNLKNFISKQS